VTDAAHGLPRFTGAVLAGGRSRRFATDKCLHVYRGSTLLEHALGTLREADETLIIGRPRGETTDARWIPDVHPGHGATSGLHAALASARHDWVAIIGCDMPFLPPTIWSLLFRHTNDARIVVPESADGLEPLAALYHRDVLPVVEQRLQAGGSPIRWLLKDLPSHVVPWRDLQPHLPPDAFLNANRPEDLP